MGRGRGRAFPSGDYWGKRVQFYHMPGRGVKTETLANNTNNYHAMKCKEIGTSTLLSSSIPQVQLL